MIKPIILIPAYQPGQELLDLVEELSRDPEQRMIIINDGSTGPSRDFFDLIDTRQGQIKILHHAVNLGKGQALKTGFNYFLVHYADDCVGVITADADGQHAVNDILRLSATLQAYPNALCLGYRQLDKNIPLRRLLGNKLTILVFKMVTGLALLDTQTGLRGIPKDFLFDLLHSPESGYDFELDMLIRAARSQRKIHEIPIQTIYMQQNKGSHFNYLRDSFKIYFVFLRFSFTSLATAVLDYITFALFLGYSQNILTSIIVARIVAGTFQFTMGKFLVFKSNNRVTGEIIKYVLLVLTLMILSYSLISPMVTYLNFSPYLSKILAEGAIFLLSFAAQALFVYAAKSSQGEGTNWDLYYATPFKTASLSRKFTERKLHSLIDAFTQGTIKHVCELGGGNSYFFPGIRDKFPGVFYTIIDNNQRGLELFGEQHLGEPNITLVNKSVLDPAFSSEPADLVFSVGLIEHFEPVGTARAIQSHFTCTKPGSTVIITFPTPTWLYVIARSLTESVGVWRFPDERPLSMNEVVTEIAKHGEVLHTSINWPIIFTQGIVVARVK